MLQSTQTKGRCSGELDGEISGESFRAGNCGSTYGQTGFQMVRRDYRVDENAMLRDVIRGSRTGSRGSKSPVEINNPLRVGTAQGPMTPGARLCST